MSNEAFNGQYFSGETIWNKSWSIRKPKKGLILQHSVTLDLQLNSLDDILQTMDSSTKHSIVPLDISGVEFQLSQLTDWVQHNLMAHIF